MSLARPRATLLGIEKRPPAQLVRRFAEVVKRRVAGGFGGCVGVYLPSAGDVAWACRYRPRTSLADPSAWTRQEPRLVLGGSWWSNGALLVRVSGEGRSPRALKRLWTRADRVKRILLYYHPRVYHAPVARAEAFGIGRWFDARCLDLIWTRYPASGAALDWSGTGALVWEDPQYGPVALLQGLRLSGRAERLFRWMEALRCQESWV